MTFEQFVATRQQSEDLAADFGLDNDTQVRGFTYCDQNWWIEEMGSEYHTVYTKNDGDNEFHGMLDECEYWLYEQLVVDGQLEPVENEPIWG